MTTNLAKWASNDGQIIKSGLSDGRRAKFLPSVVGVVYDWLRYECHLGNVGLYCRLTHMGDVLIGEIDILELEFG